VEKTMNDWLWTYDGFDPKKEGLREALCAVGNGYFVTRAAAPESQADDIHYPGTYIAGGYNRLYTQLNGHSVENEDLVNMPNWLCLTFRIEDEEWFDLTKVKLLSYQLKLDLKHGILHRDIRFQDTQGRQTRLQERRIVHMRHRHLAALQTTITTENWSGKIEFKTALDGRVENLNIPEFRELNHKHLVPIETDVIDEETLYLKVETSQSKIQVAQTARTRLFQQDKICTVKRQHDQEAGYIAQNMTMTLKQNEPITIEKVIAMYTSRDRAISESGQATQEAVERAADFNELLRDHEDTWSILWKHFDMVLTLKETVKTGYNPLLILRLHTFQLLQTACHNTIDLDVGIPARGWDGEGYRGHIFWDDIFIFPFLNLRLPEVTRTLLMYRYRRLDEARFQAQKAGYRGAMYPWQSGSTGQDETPVAFFNKRSDEWMKDNSYLERHVNSDIAYNIWQYYEATQDMEFLNFYGAEMILEIARFWASVAEYNPQESRYEIHGVVGPDEYHSQYPGAEKPGINNNSYTNIMAVWVFCTALKMLKIMPSDRTQELFLKLRLHPEELKQWDDISRKMKVVFQADGIISQFEGFEQLKDLDWEHYRQKYGETAFQRLDMILQAEGGTTNDYKLTKQADVLMLFFLFSSEELKELFELMGYPYHKNMIPKNIAYYIKLTVNGSTLSRIADSWVLARSDRSGSWACFREALLSDVTDVHGGSTPGGIHLGAMAGTVDLVQRCYTGIVTRNDILWFNPNLPDLLERLSLQIRYRGHTLALNFYKHKMQVTSNACTAGEIQFGFKNTVYTLKPGECKEFKLTQPHHPEKQESLQR
jgi:alpha,alpha-trehalase